MTEPYALTSADIVDLRGSVRWRLTNATLGVPEHVAFICYAREDPMSQNAPGYSPGAFALHAYGHRQAVSDRLEVLAACLRCEASEPGFIRRIMNLSEDPNLMVLSPDLLAAQRSRRAFEAKRLREYAAEQSREEAKAAEQARAKAKALDPAKTTLDDLL